MRYTSTRDASISCTFEEAICSGYAPDGGLFIPSNLPEIDDITLKSWSGLSYTSLASAVIRNFISHDEITDDELHKICQKSFSDGFEEKNGSTVPVIRHGSGFITELFHGPTFCFKDLGMRAVINFLSHFASKRKQKITLLVSTTGDTGPAAVQAVSDVANPFLNLLVHYPSGQISSFQRRQLTTVDSPNVYVATFEGGGDDMDAPIKRILASSTLVGGDDNGQKQLLCGVNSYNIGRPLMQMVHFIWTYFRVTEEMGIAPGDKESPVDIILPTGAQGNIAGGYMAKKMGVPIGYLCSGVNINDISHQVVKTGKFHKSACMKKTLSEAINIQVPYNFERLLFYLSDEDHNLVKSWMTTMDTTAKLDLNSFWHKKLQAEFKSARITDTEMCSATKKTYDKHNYFIDPHTAVAIAAADKLGYLSSNTDDRNYVPYAILSTASPCKFEESVTVAMGNEAWDQFYKLEFPERAKAVMEKKEIPATCYQWKKGLTLDEVQTLWEKQAREIITRKFGS